MLLPSACLGYPHSIIRLRVWLYRRWMKKHGLPQNILQIRDELHRRGLKVTPENVEALWSERYLTNVIPVLKKNICNSLGIKLNASPLEIGKAWEKKAKNQ